MLMFHSVTNACIRPRAVLYYICNQRSYPMLTTKEKVAMNLCYLIQGDYELSNDIIIEYLDLVSNKRLEDLLEFSNNEMRANV